MTAMLRTILVDDEKPALKALAYLLKQYPYIKIIGTFTDVDEALMALEKETVHLLFLDIDMPKSNGIEAAKKILANNSKINIIFVTAYSSFAVEAFELNAFDYIMKPIDPKRLKKTMERVDPRQYPSLDSILTQQKQTIFLNSLLNKKISNPEEIIQQAESLYINFTQPFSFFFLLLTNQNRQPLEKYSDKTLQTIDELVHKISRQPNLLAWRTPQGIGVLDHSAISSPDCKKEELIKASYLQAVAETYFSEVKVVVGISEYSSKIETFPARYIQARNTAIIGVQLYPELSTYHFLDNEFLAVLDQYIDQQKATKLVNSTIGKILEYDQVNGTNLFRTMEAIIFSNNLQDVAHKLFIHYRTVLFRKQNIEKILGFSMNSFLGRTMLGVALTFFYLQNIPFIDEPKQTSVNDP